CRLSAARSGPLHVLPAVPTRRSSDLSPALKRAGSMRVRTAGPGLRSGARLEAEQGADRVVPRLGASGRAGLAAGGPGADHTGFRSEEHTSELQSRENLVCRLLLEQQN